MNSGETQGGRNADSSHIEQFQNRQAQLGKSGTDGTYPNFFDQALEVRLSWWEWGAAFFARPLFLAASGRRIEASNAATNSGVPSGRPV